MTISDSSIDLARPRSSSKRKGGGRPLLLLRGIKRRIVMSEIKTTQEKIDEIKSKIEDLEEELQELLEQELEEEEEESKDIEIKQEWNEKVQKAERD
jgi:hypothetical protein